MTVMSILAKEHAATDIAKTILCTAAEPGAYKAFLADYYGTDAKEAKTLLYQAVFGGTPPDGNPFLWVIAMESRMLAEHLLHTDELNHFNDKYADRPNPLASRPAAICSTTECKYLMKFKEAIQRAAP